MMNGGNESNGKASCLTVTNKLDTDWELQTYKCDVGHEKVGSFLSIPSIHAIIRENHLNKKKMRNEMDN